MSAYRSSLFWSLKKEVSEKLPQGSLATGAELLVLPKASNSPESEANRRPC